MPSVRGEERGRRQRQVPLPELLPDDRAYVTEMPYWAPVASQAQQEQQQQSWGMSTPYTAPSMGAQHMEHDPWVGAMPLGGNAAGAHAAMSFTGEHASAAGACSGHVDPDMDILGPVHDYNTHSFR